MALQKNVTGFSEGLVRLLDGRVSRISYMEAMCSKDAVGLTPQQIYLCQKTFGLLLEVSVQRAAEVLLISNFFLRNINVRVGEGCNKRDSKRTVGSESANMETLATQLSCRRPSVEDAVECSPVVEVLSRDICRPTLGGEFIDGPDIAIRVCSTTIKSLTAAKSKDDAESEDDKEDGEDEDEDEDDGDEDEDEDDDNNEEEYGKGEGEEDASSDDGAEENQGAGDDAEGAGDEEEEEDDEEDEEEANDKGGSDEDDEDDDDVDEEEEDDQGEEGEEEEEDDDLDDEDAKEDDEDDEDEESIQPPKKRKK